MSVVFQNLKQNLVTSEHAMIKAKGRNDSLFFSWIKVEAF